MLDFFRIYLLGGMLVHKLVWELMKRSTPHSDTVPPSEKSIAKQLIKIAKFGALLFFLIQALLLPAIFPIQDDPKLIRIIGLSIYSAGLVIAIVGRIQLGVNWANIEDFQVIRGQQLVQSGIYRFIRHPIYTGDLLLVLGLELALNSWLVLLVIPLFLYVNQQAKAEEAALSTVFPDYAGYKQHTKMFIPMVY